MATERFMGRVKWFNNKAGYGFITVTDGPKSGTDVFVHHSAIKVDSEQYKYLVQGEYIEFSLSDTKTGDHEFQAGGVSGIKGGKLMCETRHEFKQTRTNYAESGEEQPVRMPRSTSAPGTTPRGQGPREGQDWSLVKGGREQSGRGFSSGGRGNSTRGGRGRGRPQRTTSQEA